MSQDIRRDAALARAMGKPETDLDHVRRQRDGYRDGLLFQSERAYKANMRALDFERQRDLARDVAQALEEELARAVILPEDWSQQLYEAWNTPASFTAVCDLISSWQSQDSGTDVGTSQGSSNEWHAWRSAEGCAHADCDDCGEPISHHPEWPPPPREPTCIHRTPRQWTKGDPEPEAVERVADRDRTHWMRSAKAGWCVVGETYDGPPKLYQGAAWPHVLSYAPLTEVQPVPTEAAPNPPDDFIQRDIGESRTRDAEGTEPR